MNGILIMCCAQNRLDFPLHRLSLTSLILDLFLRSKKSFKRSWIYCYVILSPQVLLFLRRFAEINPTLRILNLYFVLSFAYLPLNYSLIGSMKDSVQALMLNQYSRRLNHFTFTIHQPKIY